MLSSTLPGGVIMGKSLSFSDSHPWGGGGDTTHRPVCSRTLSSHRINVNLTMSLGTVSSSLLGCPQYLWCKVNSYKVSSVLCFFIKAVRIFHIPPLCPGVNPTAALLGLTGLCFSRWELGRSLQN